MLLDQAICIVGIVVTISILVFKFFVRLKKQHQLLEDDFAIFIAVALYISVAAAYIADIRYMYPVMDFLSGEIPFSPSLYDSYAGMMRYNWAVNILFWSVLWSVKISLLLFFRRVMLRTTYMTWWWLILAFTCATFLGCIVTLFTACDSLRDNFILGTQSLKLR